MNTSTTKAFMLRKDGKVIRVNYHPYCTFGDTEPDFDSTVASAQWIYENSTDDSIKNDIVELLSNKCEEEGISIEELYDYYATDDAIEAAQKGFMKILESKYNPTNADEDTLLNKINNYLNNNFLRFRYGGRYDSDHNMSEIVFRISSQGFNWFNLIWEYVYSHKREITCITVVKDQETFGVDTVYEVNGNKLDKFPIDEFILLSGNPIIEKLNSKESETTMKDLTWVDKRKSSMEDEDDDEYLVTDAEEVMSPDKYDLLKSLYDEDLDEEVSGESLEESIDNIPDVTGVIPGAMRHAKDTAEEIDDEIEKAFKEKEKEAKEFTKINNRRETKKVTSPDLKKMHLSESLFEDLDNDDSMRCVWDALDDIAYLYETMEDFSDEDWEDYENVTSTLSMISEAASKAHYYYDIYSDSKKSSTNESIDNASLTDDENVD